MARSLAEIRAARPTVDRKVVEATGEEDIRRHMIADGEDPNASLSPFVKRRPGQRGDAPGRPKGHVATIGPRSRAIEP